MDESEEPLSKKPPHGCACGFATASPLNVRYRVNRVAKYLGGRWLDVGCADGGYARELLARGVLELEGIDVEPDRVEAAKARKLPNATFRVAASEALPFGDGYFDGVWINEVFEHVADENRTLAEIRRVLKPGGCLVLISPNRWFPIECHPVKLGRHIFRLAPVVPWLPSRVTARIRTARNYWPHELCDRVTNAGFQIEYRSFIWPVLEFNPWLPGRSRAWYQRRLDIMHSLLGIRRFGVSTLVVALRTGFG
jgi:2-polyprenyl-3-methyl-5-hydroxy-6-metoxy-1,4-benzoquinol methylase